MVGDILKAGFKQALSLAIVGLFTGVVAGWLGLLLADSIPGIAAVAAKVYLALGVLLPVALFLLNWQPQVPARYATLGKAVGLLAIASLVGSVGASVFFLVPATNIPTIFGDSNPVALSQALQQQIGWERLAIVAVITVAIAPIVAWRSHQQVTRDPL